MQLHPSNALPTAYRIIAGKIGHGPIVGHTCTVHRATHKVAASQHLNLLPLFGLGRECRHPRGGDPEASTDDAAAGTETSEATSSSARATATPAAAAATSAATVRPSPGDSHHIRRHDAARHCGAVLFSGHSSATESC